MFGKFYIPPYFYIFPWTMGPWVHGSMGTIKSLRKPIILKETYPILKETYQILNGALGPGRQGPDVRARTLGPGRWGPGVGPGC